MLNDHTRLSSSFKTSTHCVFACLEKPDILSILSTHANEKIADRCAFIKGYSFFEHLTNRELLMLGLLFDEMHYQHGESIYDAYSANTDDIFFVKEGSFMHQAVVENSRILVPNLKQKKCFTFTNIAPIIERGFFGVEAFNANHVRKFYT